MKLAYLGTPEVAVPPLEELHAAGHEVGLVVTNPDRRRGRGGDVSPSPVKAAAARLGLTVSHDVDDVIGVAEAGKAEVGVVVAFGQIIRPAVLAAVPMVNLHFSLLPRWRGAAPLERAILEGDAVTGVCLMRVTEGLDEGAVYARREVPIGADVTLEELRAELVEVGTALLVEQLSAPPSTWLDEATPQVGEPTYAGKLTPADREIDWAAPMTLAHRQVRIGGAWTTFRGRRLIIVAADLVEGVLVPRMVQPAGKAPMPFEAWRNGARPGPDELFGQS
jgi:methionyl-tRNA formyltransferase